jgi:hypothetical protein
MKNSNTIDLEVTCLDGTGGNGIRLTSRPNDDVIRGGLRLMAQVG